MAASRHSQGSLFAIVFSLILYVSATDTEDLTFTRSRYNATIPENSVAKTQVVSTEKMGMFISDPMLVVRYKIVSGDPDRFFKAETRLVGDFWFLSIRVRTGSYAVLNREYQDTYELTVRATITSQIRRQLKLKAQTQVVVHVTDTNDLSPIFYPTNTYDVTVPEDTPLHRNLLQVHAFDPDLGVNGEVYYSLAEPNLQFSLHPSRGTLTLTRPLDYQKKPFHQLTVVAEDRGAKFRAADVRASSATVRLKVTPVNLHPPEIFVRQFPALLTPADPNIYAVVHVLDKDQGIHGQLDSLEIIDEDPRGLFKITRGTKLNEYNIELDHPLSKESLNSEEYTITLRAKDKGTPPKSTTQIVTVRLSEAAEIYPAFTQVDYDVEMDEVSPPGSRVLHLATSIPEGRGLFYKIENGNGNGTFAIHPESGLLTTAMHLDREVQAYYSLTVSAFDPSTRGPKRKTTTIVNVNVLDNNDNNPVFNSTLETITVDENRPAGSVVYTAFAADKDEGDNGFVTYSLANLNPVPFTMDPFTGEIRTTEVLDYETMRRDYVLKVRASDWGAPYRRQAEMTLKVRLKDVNDHRPLFEKVGCVGYVSESAPLHTEILTLSAIDFDTGSSVSYVMVPSNDDPCFRLDTKTGVIVLTCNLAKQNLRQKVINVSATDGIHFADVMSIRFKIVSSSGNHRLADRGALMECKNVGVTDRYQKQLNLAQANNRDNDVTEPTPTSYGGNKYTPEFPLGLPTEVWINESLPVGSEVLSMKARDKDRGYSGRLVYVISSGDEFCYFEIGLYDGRLVVASQLDRERKSRYDLNISVFDLGKPQLFSSRAIVVHVDDVNDNKPTFEKSSYNFVIPENVKNGTSIVRLRASDKDEGVNAEMIFTLETDLEEFHIDPSSGLLTAVGPLDREAKDIYRLKARVTDGSPDQPLSSTTVVNIRVLDINDNPPAFSLPQYWVKVREDLPVGVVIMVMPAVDPDSDVGGQVSYELSGDNTFDIDPLMGVVRLVQPLDFESRQLYNVTVAAHDGGSPSLSSKTFLIVEVEDVNENMHPPQFEDVVVVGKVRENQPPGTMVTRVSAYDADGPGLNGQFTYSIRDGDGMGFFSIDNQGNIRTSEVLDRETNSRFWLTVHAMDRGAVPLSGRVDVYIEIEDENDNTPLSFEPAYYPSVPENAPPGTSVIQVKAFDNDDDDVSLHYSIASGNPQGYFSINNSTGLITTSSPRLLDRESLAEHVLEIKISDNGNPPLSSMTRVVVNVEDTNDHDPEFDAPTYRCPVLQKKPTGDDLVLCQVFASDADIGLNGNVTYSIMEGKGTSVFRINSRTGAIFSEQDLSAGTTYDFLVKATDHGFPQRSSTIRVLVEVLPHPSASLHPPAFKDMDWHVAVLENDKVWHLVSLIEAEDPDGDRIWKYIVGGNEDDTFLLEPIGALRLAKRLDWERNSEYILNISITDGIYSVFHELKIQVIDMNDHRPVFSQEVYKVDLTENTAIGEEILQLEATDGDEDKRLFFSIYNGANALSLQLFQIDTISGKLSLASSVDHESIKEHILTVKVRDHGTPSKRSFARVIITVHDQNDHHPEFLAPIFEGQVYETASLGTSVLQVLAVDKDKGQNAQLQFSIASGNIGSVFAIDPVFGTILVSKQLDRQIMPEYFLVVRASDKGMPSLNSTVTVHVMVTVANNAPPKFEHDEYAVELYENEKPGEIVVPVIATSRSSIYYEIVSGDVFESFIINPMSGVLRTNAVLDFEAIKFYNLTVQATNMVGANSTVSVFVHVLDRNDNPPIFVQKEYFGEVIESTAAGSMVLVNASKPLVVSAYDNDSEINSVLKYKILEKSALEYFNINPNTGAIRTVSALDYEKHSNFFFTVQVWDMGKPRFNAEVPAKVFISVTDVNDCPPYFDKSYYTALVLLPTYQGVQVTTVHASDPDSMSKIKYAIISGNAGKKFHVDEDSGNIYISDPENLVSKYTLVVGATDGEFETSTKVMIKIQDNQNSGFQFSKEKYFARVEENSTEVHTVAVVTVLGTALHEHLSFHIINPTHMFKIGETSGVVRTTGRIFDREQQNLHTLVVEVKSEPKDHHPKVAHILVEVSVIDINDNAPFFIKEPYYAVVPIDAPLHYSVIKVEARDLDSGLNGEITYEITDGDRRVFHMDKDSGEISVLQTLTGSKYDLVVSATDQGTPSLSSRTQVAIHIISRDMPVFPQQFYETTVLENLPTGATLMAISANSPHGRQLIYSFVAGNRKEDFGLNFNTEPSLDLGPCVITVVEELDYETTPSYFLTLKATDAISGIFSDVRVTIHVQDVNDNPPMFTQPSYNTTVSEATPFGTSILQVKATDRDFGANKLVQYHIVGNATTHFHIDTAEGIVFIKQPLDHETQKEHYFAVMATDGGHPILSSTAHVWITVADMNDNPPRFDNVFYRCVISQEVKRGQFVTMVIASDPDASDQSKLKYAITGGNDLQSFTINKFSGIITLSNLNHFSLETSYILNVSVTDGVHSTYATVFVNIQGANNHSPYFSRTAYEVALPENAPAGRMIAIVSAEDKDIGNYGQVEYVIQSKASHRLFSIDSHTGEIRTKVPLDREEQHLYTLIVSAVDSGGRCGFTTVRVTVTDENDNMPQFSVSEYRTTVPVNATIGTTILKMHATDKDDGPAATLEYSIYKSNNTAVNELFGITHDNGEIYLRKSAVGHANFVYQFFVQVEDKGPLSHEAVVPINIAFIDSQESYPRFDRLKYEFYLSEKAAIGTIVSTLNTSCTYPVQYSLTPAPKDSDAELYLSKFSIDEHGSIILMAEIDREEQSTYFLNVRAETESTPSRISCADVIIIVMDDNDNNPKFESDLYSVTVAENIEKGASILKVVASDIDIGDSKLITYRFGPDADSVANVFQLDSKSGWLTTMILLDREDTPFYNFTVQAFNPGLPLRMSTTVINIYLQDYNDNPPEFQMQHYRHAVLEDAAPGTSVATFYTTDRDEEQSTIEFYITDGNPQGQFQILKSGKLVIKKPLDREDIANYELEITATDGKFVTKSWVSIDVSDVNDNPPVCLKTKYTELVSENIVPQTYILTIEATDADSYNNSRLYYFLSGKGSEDFSVDPLTGVLKTSRPIDREKTSRYSFTAHVQDVGHPEWECTSVIEVLLSDVNDNPPIFTQEVYSVTVPEDSEVGTLIAKVHATDIDIGYNRKVKYSLVDSASNHFRIDESTGIVHLSKAVDREEVAMYNLTIQASDHGIPQMSSLSTLLVIVQDINDNPPEFTSKYYYAIVPETASIGTEVLKVVATSRDSGVNAEITYHVLTDPKAPPFSIHPKSGIISVSSHLDYEVAHNYYVTIQAVDGGTPPLSAEVAVNITITDSNDNAPEFTLSSYTAVIREDAIIGDKIIQVIATDADSPPNAQLTYSILSGDRFGEFLIDEELGYISTASELDREKVSNYILEILCEDSGSPHLSSTTLVNVEISDVNDNPPLFSEENYTAIVQEGKPLGFTVIKFTVTDQDAPPNTGPFIFDILSGNEDNAFRLVQQDATLRTANRFDHKNRSEYSLRVRVTDGGNPPLYSDTWVSILVIEESRYAPVVTPLDVAVSSYMDEFPGGVMGRVHATDQDPYDKLIFDIVSHHENLFTIDREDGTLVALPGLDIGTYEVNVSISDGKFTTYTTVAVDVSMITTDALKNGVAIRLDDVTPEDFLLTYKKGFLRGLRNILNIRTKDVEIISVQPTMEDSTKHLKRSTHQDLDVVFAIHQGINGFYSSELIRNKIKEKKDILEANIGLKVVKVMENRCTEERCINGKCIDRIVLDGSYSISITTDALSYVCPQHYRKLECSCDPGFGGPQCELAVNECSRRPCPSYRMCIPDATVLGYICKCPEGKTGSTCNRDASSVCKPPACYEEKTPVSFVGKSYISYVLSKAIDQRMSVALHIRTKQNTGNIMYAAGARDYTILEITNGMVQYRFDCGSGEGVIRIEQVKISDGNWHEIKVERRGKRAEVIVDNRFRRSGDSSGSHEILNLDGRDIFFGAEVRNHFELLGPEDIRMGFIGCMDDLRIEGVPLPMHYSGNNLVATLNRFSKMELHCGELVELGVCGNQPCHNGGTCIPSEVGFSCHCHPQFLGSLCETDTIPCASSPCLNGGSCQKGDNDFLCTCPPGITGKRCEYGRYCKPNPCQNGGLCEEGTYSAICKCRGYHGESCQYDINECQAMPCAIGATCTNLKGSFRCHCPPNMTGLLCNDHLYTTSITSSSWNTTIEEIVGISLAILIILLLAMALVCCWRYRHKRQQLRPNNEVLDTATNEFLLKNTVYEKDNFNRISKISNLEVTTFTTPPLPPRPASYTPSTQDTVQAMNNFGTVRSYGSAADDLENFPRQGNDYVQKINKPPIPAMNQTLPSSSDNDSIKKGVWEQESSQSKDKLYENKVQKELQPRKSDVPMRNNIPAPAVPSRGPSSLGVPSVLSLTSDDLPDYIWDCSDWASSHKPPLPNIVEVSTKEIRDSSSVPSTESNSRASQIELLPAKETEMNMLNLTRVPKNQTGSQDFERTDSEYVGDSENNDNDFDDSTLPGPNFENILKMTDLEFVDDGAESLPTSPHKYQRHPNSYLPPHSLGTTDTSPDHLWMANHRQQICDLSDDEVMTYGFPPQGGRGFHIEAENEDLVHAPGLDTMSMSVGGFTSTNASYSDISGAVCEIDDSEANFSDVDYEATEVKPLPFPQDKLCSTHL